MLDTDDHVIDFYLRVVGHYYVKRISTTDSGLLKLHSKVYGLAAAEVLLGLGRP